MTKMPRTLGVGGGAKIEFTFLHSMKRTREDEDPSVDPITSDKWITPHVLIYCGHVVSSSYLASISVGPQLYCCPFCRSNSPVIKLRTPCLFEEEEEEEEEIKEERRATNKASANAKPPSLSNVLHEARERRQAIFMRCMEALRGVLVKEISLHHWQSSLHPSLMEEPAFMFDFETLRERGIFQNATDFIVVLTYREGCYCDYFKGDGILLTMWLENKPRTGPELLKRSHHFSRFRQNPEKYRIAIQYRCADGYDGEASASQQTH